MHANMKVENYTRSLIAAGVANRRHIIKVGKYLLLDGNSAASRITTVLSELAGFEFHTIDISGLANNGKTEKVEKLFCRNLCYRVW